MTRPPLQLSSFMLRCDAPSWGLYENHLPGLAGSAGGCIAKARLDGESGPKGG